MSGPIIHSLAVAVLFFAVQRARAQVVLDQEYVVGYPGALNYTLDYPGDHLAQTFTVRHSGILTRIGIQVSLYVRDRFIYDPPTEELHYGVVRVDANRFALVDDVLAAGRIHPDALPVTTSGAPGPLAFIDVSNADLRAHAGEQLAIAFNIGGFQH
jgi:hypothetical protein